MKEDIRGKIKDYKEYFYQVFSLQKGLHLFFPFFGIIYWLILNFLYTFFFDMHCGNFFCYELFVILPSFFASLLMFLFLYQAGEFFYNKVLDGFFSNSVEFRLANIYYIIISLISFCIIAYIFGLLVEKAFSRKWARWVLLSLFILLFLFLLSISKETEIFLLLSPFPIWPLFIVLRYFVKKGKMIKASFIVSSLLLFLMIALFIFSPIIFYN